MPASSLLPGAAEADGPFLDRRAFLKMATATLTVAPAASLLGGLLHPTDASAATGPTVTLGGASVRPPSVPLAVRSPYLSTWLPATELTATTAQFWHGENRGFVGLVTIDGTTSTWAGQPEVNGATPPALTQTALDVTATRSTFTFNESGVELVAEWLSPIEPGDLRRQSSPLALLTVTVRATDGSHHTVSLYADITGEWASSDTSAVIQWQTDAGATSRAWSVQLQDQQPLTEDASMAQWGTALWAAPLASGLTYQSGEAGAVRTGFATSGQLADTSDPDFRAIDDDEPVFAFASDLGSVGGSGQSVSFVLGHVRTPLVSFGQGATPLVPLWTTYWSDWQAMVDDFVADAGAARGRAAQLDTKIRDAATHAAGTGYSAICALALRQCYGGVELAVGPEGTPWLMGKEISSGGDTNTVDIFDQAFLAWLWLDPGLIPLLLDPILTWCASPAWQDPSAWAGIPSWEDSQTMYCVHDLGVYPNATGRVPGAGEQMPIEESAGMLIMAAAYARKVGPGTAKDFLAKWETLWGQWAAYLLTQVPTPATQLTTDDWAPVYLTPTGSVNLGIKAIIGLAAAGQIADIVGDSSNASTWSKAAADNVAPWVSLSTDPSGNYLNLEQGAGGTWSTLYNAYYQHVIGVGLVPKDVAAKEASFYLTQLTTYGMPLQTDAGDLTKVAWVVYVPAWLHEYPISQALLSRDVAYINDTPSLVPYGDRYNTVTGVEITGIKAHPTVGAVYAFLATQS